MKAVAMPEAVWKKRRRDRPFRRPCSSPSSLSRAATFFWRSVCAIGRYSSLETSWVGSGIRSSARQAGTVAASSSSLNMPMIDLRVLTEARHHLGPEFLDRLHEDRMRHQAVVSVAEHPIDRLALLLGLHGAQHGVDRADIGVTQLDHFI